MTNKLQVVIFGRGEKPATAALVKGAAVAGLRPILQRPHLDNGKGYVLPDVSAAFVDGVRGPYATFLAAYRAAGIPVYILELPRLRAALRDRNDYGDIFGLYRDTLADLPMALGNRVVVEGRLPVRAPRALLLVGQKPNDTAHGMTEGQMLAWAQRTARFAREQYQLPVIYRPHPKASVIPATIPGVDEIADPHAQPLRADLVHAAAVITYNSTAGVEAIDAGVPVLYTAPREMVCYADYAQRLGEPITELPEPFRRAFLMRCGATQWTLDEIAAGLPFHVLFNGAAYPEPELIEPELPPSPATRPSGRARNRAMSQEVVPDGR